MKKVNKNVLSLVMTCLASCAALAVMLVGGYYAQGAYGDAAKKLFIMVIVIAGVFNIFAGRYACLVTKSKKNSFIGVMPIVCAGLYSGIIALKLNVMIFLLVYTALVLVIAWKLAEKKNPAVFYHKDKEEKHNRFIKHCPRCGQPMGLLRFKCNCRR